MSKLEIKLYRNYSTISLLDINILLITDSFPDPMNIKKEDFKAVIGADLLSSISIVLISDPRSFYYTSLLYQIPEFNGIVLCTNAVYRLGRLFIRETTRLLTNNDIEVPTNLSIIPINFFQPYQFDEITIIPYPNGTGIGNCNWLITKGNDPALVTFNAFIVSGLCVDTESLVFSNPNAPSKPVIPHTLDIVCFLPSSISAIGCSEYLEQQSLTIMRGLQAKNKIVIPSFIDDSLFTIMHYLRYTKSISKGFNVTSFYYQKMIEILSVFSNTDLIVNDNSYQKARPNSWKLPEIIRVDVVDSDSKPSLADSDLYFAPYPTEQFGQIFIFSQMKHENPMYQLRIFYPPNEHGNIGFTSNSQWPKPFHFFDEIKDRNKNIQFIIPEEKTTSRFRFDQSNVIFCKEYSRPIDNDLVRWMELKELERNSKGRIGNHIPMIAGEMHGEKVTLKDVNQQAIFTTTSIAAIGMKLREIGADNITFDGKMINCTMPFEGDNDVSIEFDGDDIFITTGSALIESQIIKVMQEY